MESLARKAKKVLDIAKAETVCLGNSLIESWDVFFMEIAKTVSRKSKDSSTRVGAVIRGCDNELLSVGFNGIPRNVLDGVNQKRHTRPDKYLYYEHAERNAIYNAARYGVSLKGSTIYITSLFPCSDCARAIIQVGITTVVVESEKIVERWKESTDAAKEMFEEAGIDVLDYAYMM